MTRVGSTVAWCHPSPEDQWFNNSLVQMSIWSSKSLYLLLQCVKNQFDHWSLRLILMSYKNSDWKIVGPPFQSFIADLLLWLFIHGLRGLRSSWIWELQQKKPGIKAFNTITAQPKQPFPDPSFPATPSKQSSLFTFPTCSTSPCAQWSRHTVQLTLHPCNYGFWLDLALAPPKLA